MRRNPPDGVSYFDVFGQLKTSAHLSDTEAFAQSDHRLSSQSFRGFRLAGPPFSALWSRSLGHMFSGLAKIPQKMLGRESTEMDPFTFRFPSGHGRSTPWPWQPQVNHTPSSSCAAVTATAWPRGQ